MKLITRNSEFSIINEFPQNDTLVSHTTQSPMYKKTISNYKELGDVNFIVN